MRCLKHKWFVHKSEKKATDDPFSAFFIGILFFVLTSFITIMETAMPIGFPSWALGIGWMSAFVISWSIYFVGSHKGITDRSCIKCGTTRMNLTNQSKAINIIKERYQRDLKLMEKA